MTKTKKLTRTQWRELGVINDYDMAQRGGEPAVFVYYRAADNGRAYHPAAWVVVRYVNGRQVATDPGAHWSDNGHKVFTVRSREEREPQLKLALDFCRRFGIVEWEKSPLGAWHPRGTMAKAAETR